MKIQKLFTKFRNEINEREEELLKITDKEYDNLFFNENLIKEIEKLPNTTKTVIENSKNINNDHKDWNNDNKLNFLINICINIENNIKDITKINEKISKCKKYHDFKIKFYPEKENKINKFITSIKSFGKINVLEDSLILNEDTSYIDNIINWINPKGSLKTQLLYRKSRDGDSYDTFHTLCDNQGTTLVLIKSNEGFIIGGYTKLSWDNQSKWKNDDNTFLFSLTNNKVFKKNKTSSSIYCSEDAGPWFPYIGFREKGKKNMSQGEFLYYTNESDIYFNDFNNIINHESKSKFFDVVEVEIYKIL